MDSTLLPVQKARFRAMSAEEKLKLMRALWAEVRELTAVGVRWRHPDWSDAEVAVEVRHLMREVPAPEDYHLLPWFRDLG